MTRSLPITIVQNEIHWHEISHNLDAAHELLHDVRPNGLIVLPETFATGFIVNDLPSDNSAQIIEWMQRLAGDHHSAVTGSVAVHESGKWYNRLYFITPDGIVGTYDKRHLFPTSPEPELFQKGDTLPIFEYQGWRICPQICYDLRFPVWCRNSMKNSQFKYDILLYVANWPAARAHIWNTLLAARAIENQCYVVGCNCVGNDPQGRHYQGDSQIIAPSGEHIAISTPSTAMLLQADLSSTRLNAWRTRFPVSEDWD